MMGMFDDASAAYMNPTGQTDLTAAPATPAMPQAPQNPNDPMMAQKKMALAKAMAQMGGLAQTGLGGAHAGNRYEPPSVGQQALGAVGAFAPALAALMKRPPPQVAGAQPAAMPMAQPTPQAPPMDYGAAFGAA